MTDRKSMFLFEVIKHGHFWAVWVRESTTEDRISSAFTQVSFILRAETCFWDFDFLLPVQNIGACVVG